MKKILIPIGTILLSGFVQAQLTSTENYIQSRTYLEPVTTSSSTAKQIETVQYFDGLGRPKQIVNVKASPLGRDVVKPILYDGFGRQVLDYLPVPQQGTNNGAIYPQQNSGYFPVGDPAGAYTNEKPFSEKILESSPLNRILQQKQVGMAWDTKPVQFGYDANTTGDVVKKYTTVTTWVNGATSSVLSQSTNYGTAQLYKNTVTDEDGNVTIEFKNGEGQVLLVRKMINDTENADTYYVYNEYNQLAFVISPKAAMETDPNTVLGELCYQYKYDGRGRLVEKKIPGKGWEYMVYDKSDRLVATQDANQKLLNKWLFTKYDMFGRVLYTGISIDNGDRNAVQTWITNTYGVNTETYGSYTQSGLQIYYANTAYPQNIESILSVNYYDSYLPGDPFPTMVYDQVVLPSNAQQYGVSTKGLPVSSFVKNVEDDNWTKKYMYYDLKGRLIREYSPNHLGGYNNVEKRLDFSGVPNIILTQQKRLAGDTSTDITETFEYDSQNRLLVHKHRVNDNPVEILAQNTYNELSQLSNKKVGGTVASSPLQSIDYTYNIRGWMTQINDPSNLGSDLFGYKINYNLVEGQEIPNTDFPDLKVKAKYNGNIAEVSWKTLTEENEPLKRYGYVYDRLNRLNAGFYQKETNPTGKEYFEKTAYDRNGNIINLKRSEGLVSGSSTALMIDNLDYSYTGNKLTKITEQQTGNSKGYPYVPNPTYITYDNDITEGNGNMTSHPDKGISSIQYNFLNLPKQITQNGKATSYAYRADGVKVKKIFGDIETNYLSGFQYKDTYQIESWNGQGYFNQDPNEIPVMKLRIIPTTEGYYDALLNQYIYNFTDHLGNIRLSYTDTNKDGVVQPRGYFGSTICNGPFFCFQEWKPGEIVEVDNYYPFGLLHDYNAITRNAYQYKYNGKELQETGMYDYGARFYMPDVARWGVIDPLAEKMPRHSPYNYAYNNPLTFIDPDGRQGLGWINQIFPDGTQTVTYNPNVNTIQEALDAGYQHVYGVGQTGEITNSSNGSVAYTLNEDGTVTNAAGGTSSGYLTTSGGINIQARGSFDLTKWLSHLGNEGGDFYSNLGGAAPIEPYSNPFFRGDIDKMVDVDGYFGGMVNSLSRGRDWKDLMAYRVDIMALGDLAYTLLGGKDKTVNKDTLISAKVSFDNGKDSTMQFKVPKTGNIYQNWHTGNNYDEISNPYVKAKVDSAAKSRR